MNAPHPPMSADAFRLAAALNYVAERPHHFGVNKTTGSRNPRDLRKK